MGGDIAMRPSAPQIEPLDTLFRDGGIEEHEAVSVGTHGVLCCPAH
jgi:hypothetical protein